MRLGAIISLSINVLSPLLLSKEWCKLVFEGRNKKYGAYLLREKEGKYLTIALIIVVGAVVLCTLLPMFFIEWRMKKAQSEADEAIANFSRLKEPELKPQHELKAVDVAEKMNIKKIKNSIQFTPEISPDEKVDAQLILGTDEVGTTEDGRAIVSTPDSTLTTNEETSPDDPAISDRYPTPVEVVEQMPQFPGGLGALMKWLYKNVVYPPICIRDQVQGRVEVSFYVDKNGDIKDPTVTRRVHPLLDREALLTVKHMPRWTPGKVHGKVSIVRVTIPIEFCL